MMSTSSYEYKTVALPQSVMGRRKRHQSEADLVAETLGETICSEAVEGWEYMRSEILTATGRGGMFSKGETVTYYNVLIFRRVLSAVWPTDEEEVRPIPAPPKPAAPQPVAPVMPMIGDPTSPLGQGTTLTSSGQFNAVTDVPRPSPRPPLGSAKD